VPILLHTGVFCRMGHLSRNFYGLKSQIKVLMPTLPDAASFFDAYVQNLADTYTFWPDSHVFVQVVLRRCSFSAAFGKKSMIYKGIHRFRQF
jgi:hypothetical protein